MSSLDSTTSDESTSIPQTPHYYGSVNSLLSGGGGHGGGSGGSNLKDHYGSITSLASSTSLISPQVRFKISLASIHFPSLDECQETGRYSEFLCISCSFSAVSVASSLLYNIGTVNRLRVLFVRLGLSGLCEFHFTVDTICSVTKERGF